MQTLLPEDLEVLEKVTDEMNRLANVGRPFVEQDHLFHATLFSRVPNELFSKLMDLFWNLSRQLVRASIPQEDLVVSARNHRLVLEAIYAGDVNLARQRLSESFGGPPPFWSVDSA
jgi:DNA-binding FadR family transcriptional regulator